MVVHGLHLFADTQKRFVEYKRLEACIIAVQNLTLMKQAISFAKKKVNLNIIYRFKEKCNILFNKLNT